MLVFVWDLVGKWQPQYQQPCEEPRGPPRRAAQSLPAAAGWSSPAENRTENTIKNKIKRIGRRREAGGNEIGERRTAREMPLLPPRVCACGGGRAAGARGARRQVPGPRSPPGRPSKRSCALPPGPAPPPRRARTHHTPSRASPAPPPPPPRF